MNTKIRAECTGIDHCLYPEIPLVYGRFENDRELQYAEFLPISCVFTVDGRVVTGMPVETFHDYEIEVDDDKNLISITRLSRDGRGEVHLRFDNPESQQVLQAYEARIASDPC